MSRPLVTDNALRYEPEASDYAFTWVRRDPTIGMQPYIYVWPKGAVGEGQPTGRIGVDRWNSREQTPTVLDGYAAFVKRCDAWAAREGRAARGEISPYLDRPGTAKYAINPEWLLTD